MCIYTSILAILIKQYIIPTIIATTTTIYKDNHITYITYTYINKIIQ